MNDALLLQLANIERRLAQMKVEGTVHAVKWENGRQLVRVEIGSGDDGPVITDWLEKQHMAMGGVKIDAALSVGEQVSIDNSAGGGEFTPHSRVSGSGQSNNNATPASETDGLTITFGAMRLQFGADGLVLANGGAVIRLNGGNIELVSGTLTHNDVNTGDDHQHTLTMPGTGTSGPPKE